MITQYDRLITHLILFFLFGAIMGILVRGDCPYTSGNYMIKENSGITISKWEDINESGCWGVCPADVVKNESGWITVSVNASWSWNETNKTWNKGNLTLNGGRFGSILFKQEADLGGLPPFITFILNLHYGINDTSVWEKMFLEL